MKKIIFAILALGMTTMASAQSSLLNNLKSAATSAAKQAASNAVSNAKSSASSTLSSVVSSVLGTSDVSQSSLVGTWKYSKPCVAFESKNVLTNLATSAVSSKVQSYLGKGVSKAGFTAGKVTITFDKSNNVSITANGKTTTGTYAVDGSNLTLTLGVGTITKSIKMNCKLSGSNLQLAMNSSKLITLLQAVSSKSSSASSQLSSITSLTKNVSGMYTGLQFSK